MPSSTVSLTRVTGHCLNPRPSARPAETRPVTASILLPTLALALAIPGIVLASPDAEALHEEHCVSCHGSEVYTREDRRVQSREALASQVRMCEQNLGLTWFDDDVDAVTRLLNQKYYQFD